MKTKPKLLVEKAKFDAVISELLHSKPIARERIKSGGKRGSKRPIFQKP